MPVLCELHICSTVASQTLSQIILTLPISSGLGRDSKKNDTLAQELELAGIRKPLLDSVVSVLTIFCIIASKHGNVWSASVILNTRAVSALDWQNKWVVCAHLLSSEITHANTTIITTWLQLYLRKTRDRISGAKWWRQLATDQTKGPFNEEGQDKKTKGIFQECWQRYIGSRQRNR